jgi:uncharacterized membrane protein YgdD (TMEM256/DUF423 family)
VKNSWILTAAVLGAAGVTLGAFGAHGLRARLTPEQLGSWQTAVEYHLLHAVALLALGLYASATDRSVGVPAGLWTAGIVLFAGSIYGLVLGGPRWLGPVTPLGGLCLILGWLSLLLLRR